jgi:hypothetical protein
MKIQDIFRQMLDTLDGVEHTTGNPSNAVDGTGAQLSPVPVDNTDNTESETMISPLQLQVELVKQGESDESYAPYSSSCGCSGECDCPDTDSVDYEDEESDTDALTDIRQLAGITPVIISI